jgi:hypothetical protein
VGRRLILFGVFTGCEIFLGSCVMNGCGRRHYL